ncbi:hypothetical protein CYMTET_44735 [Cymbomonas tetramitiformis]|uniref:Uncharacterized protein n=1 Tax=Cymbomonas tetramitiformis TaxID=36881 RepID=A0AAE0C1H0_9CHLO|nr:hypothetical protein CYMTET_44735 [Cymbomonas tetramitiformis]
MEKSVSASSCEGEWPSLEASSSVSAMCTGDKHPFLELRQGGYYCSDCQAEIEDAARVSEENEYLRIVEEQDALRFGVGATAVECSADASHGSRGVTIDWLLRWTDAHGCWDWPTWQVVRFIVRPATRSNHCRYVELPEIATSKGVLGPADTFVSHCWGAPWGDLVGAVSDAASPQRRVWVDAFAVRQWPGNAADLDFRGVVRRCSSFVLVCTSLPEVADMLWSDARKKRHENLPVEVRRKISFFRVWCLVEIQAARLVEHVAIVMKGGSMVKETRSDQGRLGGRFFKTDARMLSNMKMLVDIEKAEASVPEDLAREMARVRAEPGGVAALNEMIQDAVATGATCAKRAVLQSAACGDAHSLQKLLGMDEVQKAEMLRACSFTGYLVVVKLLLQAGAPIDEARKETGGTALMQAAKAGRELVTAHLISAGADVLLRDQRGKSALDWAREKSHFGIARRLQAGVMKATASRMTQAEKDTALREAAREGHVEALRILLQSGADVTARDRKERSALEWAQSVNEFGKDAAARAACVSAVQEAWVPQWTRRSKCTATKKEKMGDLSWACERGHTEVVQVLLGAGVPAHPCTNKTLKKTLKPDKMNRPPILMAACNGHAAIVSLLISAGADLECTDKFNWTPFHLAAAEGHIDVLKVLLEAQPELADQGGGRYMLSPLGYAYFKRNVNCFTLLAAASKQPLKDAYLRKSAEESCPEFMRVLLRLGADHTARTGIKKRTPLESARRNMVGKGKAPDPSSEHQECIQILENAHLSETTHHSAQAAWEAAMNSLPEHSIGAQAVQLERGSSNPVRGFHSSVVRSRSEIRGYHSS